MSRQNFKKISVEPGDERIMRFIAYRYHGLKAQLNRILAAQPAELNNVKLEVSARPI